jgi:hypothetical protein
MICYIVNGAVRLWLLAFITSFLMAIVLVQWARRRQPSDCFVKVFATGLCCRAEPIR